MTTEAGAVKEEQAAVSEPSVRVQGTKINKIVLQGFKSFATRTEFLFGENFNCVLGPNGSGKSCAYDTLVALSNGEEQQIGELVEKQIEKAKKVGKLDDGIYVNGKGSISLLSLNKRTGKIEKKPVSKFIKRKGEVLYRIKTRSGKEVKATGCHPVMAFKDGEIKSVLIKDLKQKALIATPRRINIGSDKIFPLALARFLGYLIGDGYIAKNRIEFVNKNPEVLADYRRIIKKFFKAKITERREKGAVQLYFSNEKSVQGVKDLFIRNHKGSVTTIHKMIPRNLLRCNKRTIAAFLAGLYDTDGSVRKDIAVIEFCTKNKVLAHQIQGLLLRFGILSKIKERRNHATNTKKKIRRSYYYIYIHGKENLQKFYENINLRIKYKVNAIKGHLHKKSNPNTDVLPREVNKIIREVTQLLGLRYKPLRKKYPLLAAYIENRCNPTREGIAKILGLFKFKETILKNAYHDLSLDQLKLVQQMRQLNIASVFASKQIGLSKQVIGDHWATKRFNARPENLKNFFNFLKKTFELRLKSVKELLQQLKHLSSSDICWDKIQSIEKLPKVKYVYDLTVEDNHNFVANNIFVHNSNLLDSICFVLGKSSSKSLRAEKAANLIYNGGKTKKAANQAEVSIYFDNTDKTFPLEDDEIKVSRIVRKDGQSKYRINDKTRTRTEVVDLLSVAKINPDGYNIILQGDIVHFVKMSTTERRQVIEEIAGISVYEEKKQKALRELERVQERLNEAEIILKERESSLKALQKDRDQAIKYRELSDKITVNKASYVYRQMKKKEREKQEYDKMITELQQKRDKHSNLIEEKRKKINELRNTVKKITAEIEARGEDSQVSLNRSIEELKTLIITKKARAETCKGEIEKIDEKQQQLENDTQQIEESITQVKEDSDAILAEIKNVEDQKKKIESKIADFKEKHSLAHLGDIEKEIDQLEKKAEEKQQALQGLREEQQTLIREVDKTHFQLEGVDDRISKVRELEKEQKDQIEELKNKRTLFKRAAVELNKRLNDDSGIAAQLSNARQKEQSLEEEVSKLQIRSAGIREKVANNSALQYILGQKNKIGGIYGAVSELGSVDTKYSLALEVAAGKKIQSVVVDTDNTASECIRLLKKQKAGVATFIPLNKIKAPGLNPNVKTVLKAKGVHGLASQLVSYDPKFKKAFEFVFGNTLIVDNIDVSRRIGIGKTKMVTLEGDVAERSGAMIGGYIDRKRRSVGFQEKEVTETLQRVEQELEQQHTIVSRLQKEKKENEERIVVLREEKASLEGDIIKLERSLHLDPEDLKASEEHKKVLNEQLEKAEKKLQSVQDAISEGTRGIAEIKAQKQQLREKINQLRSPTLIAELTAFDQKRSELAEQLITLHASVKNNDTKLKTIYLPEQEKLQKLQKNMEKEKTTFSKEIKEIENTVAKEQESLKEKEKEAKAFYQQFREAFDNKQQVMEEIQKHEEVVFKQEEAVRKVELKINGTSVSLAEVRATLTQLQTQFSEFGNVDLDENKSEADLKKEIDQFEKMKENLGMVNLRSLEVYDQVEKEYKTLVEKKDVLKKEKEDVLVLMNEIETKKKALFLQTFKMIDKNFRAVFASLSRKGNAYLELENTEDPFAGGVGVKVKLSGTKFIDLKSLSGGEQTLTSLAFIFSIQEHEPASFYVMDEVDAALDKENSEKLAKLIQKYSERAQYVVISHNDNVISKAHNLYGITMNEHGQSSAVSMKLT